MRINSLASAIRRGLWALDVTNIELYAPVVEAILSGKGIDYHGQPKASSLFSLVDNYGNLKYPDAKGAIEVPPNSIAQIAMVGEVIKSGDICTYGADDIVDSLYRAQANPNIDAIIFHIDTPGGEVAAIDVFRDFAANKTKPVVGLLDDTLSLGFWAACEICDYKMSNGNVSPRFGSIGVVATAMDYALALKERGIIKHEILSTLSEHKRLAFTNALNGDYTMLQEEHLDPLAVKFQKAVIDTCPNLLQEEGVLSGKTFYADEALRLGMIDSIGNPRAAVAKARAIALKQNVSSIN